MSFTLNDIALLLIALLIGLILGLMLSGRGKYKRLWREEQIAHRHMMKDRDARIEAANARAVDDRHHAPLAAGTAAAASHGRDDLSRVRGISQSQEAMLNEAGYHRYSQIAGMSAEQEATLESRMGLKPGTIAYEEWREQARLLDGRAHEEHERRYTRRMSPL